MWVAFGMSTIGYRTDREEQVQDGRPVVVDEDFF